LQFLGKKDIHAQNANSYNYQTFNQKE
jgi:hypothetical protein